MRERANLIEENRPVLSVRQQCGLLEVNRSRLYYEPIEKELTANQLTLLRLVDEVYTQHPFFGSRQMSDYLSLHYYPIKRHEAR